MGLLGRALLDHYRGSRDIPLMVECDRAADEEMKREQFFLPMHEMPLLDRSAVEAARGFVLDVGAGAGRHSLALQERGHICTALEADSDCASLCRMQGVHLVENLRWQDYTPGPIYDTALALMNGAGLAGTYAGLSTYLDWLAGCLAPAGRVLLDTSSVAYLPRSREAGRRIDEVWFAFRYGQDRTERFSWLFLDKGDLERQLRKAGFTNIRALDAEPKGRWLIQAQKA